MSQQTRLETLQAMQEEIQAEKRELMRRLAALNEEASLVSMMLKHYATVNGASLVIPEERDMALRAAVNRNIQSSSGTSIPNEIVAVMREAGEPLHYRRDILPRLLQRGVVISGKDLARSVSAHLSDPRFARVPDMPGYWTLSSWVKDRGEQREQQRTEEPVSQQESAREERADKPSRVISVKDLLWTPSPVAAPAAAASTLLPHSSDRG